MSTLYRPLRRTPSTPSRTLELYEGRPPDRAVSALRGGEPMRISGPTVGWVLTADVRPAIEAESRIRLIVLGFPPSHRSYLAEFLA